MLLTIKSPQGVTKNNIFDQGAFSSENKNLIILRGFERREKVVFTVVKASQGVEMGPQSFWEDGGPVCDNQYGGQDGGSCERVNAVPDEFLVPFFVNASRTN